MTITNRHVFQDRFLLQECILPFLVDIDNRKETTDLKRVCKLWNELLNNSMSYPRRVILHPNSIISNNLHFFTEYESWILTRIQRGSPYTNKRLVHHAFRILPSDARITKRSYLNRFETINLATVNSVATITVLSTGIVGICFLAWMFLSDIADSNLSESQMSDPTSRTLENFKMREFKLGNRQTAFLGALVLIVGIFPVIIHPIFNGRIPQIQRAFRYILSLRDPIKKSIEIAHLRNRRHAMGCGQRVINRLASIFSGIRKVPFIELFRSELTRG